MPKIITDMRVAKPDMNHVPLAGRITGIFLLIFFVLKNSIQRKLRKQFF